MRSDLFDPRCTMHRRMIVYKDRHYVIVGRYTRVDLGCRGDDYQNVTGFEVRPMVADKNGQMRYVQPQKISNQMLLDAEHCLLTEEEDTRPRAPPET